jgi:hypothetical protein
VLGACVAFVGLWLGAASAQEPATRPGEVTLPLDRYLGLVARAEREVTVEPQVASVSRQTVRIAIGDDAVSAITEIAVVVRGARLEPLPLAVAGTVEGVRVEPADAGSLGWPTPPGAVEVTQRRTQTPLQTTSTQGPVFLARRAGDARLELAGRLPAPSASGATRIELPAAGAPLSVAEITLASTLRWSAPGAVVVEDQENAAAGTRRLVLALPSDRPVLFSTRRPGASDGASDETLAQTVTATRLDVGALGYARSDVVLYEITRGELPAVHLAVPQGLEVERAATSGGSALILDEGDEGSDDGGSGARRLRIEPEQPLRGLAFVRLEQRPSVVEADSFEVPLDAVRPSIAPRARYLLLATEIAAELVPAADSGWQRVDATDLPPALAAALPGRPPVSVWRRGAADPANAGDRAGVLRVARVPLAAHTETLVRWRRSSTLLTPEGTVVQRELLGVASRAGSLELVLPDDAVVWMARVGGLLVRPVIAGRSVRLPLWSAENQGTEDQSTEEAGAAIEVELLSVTEGAVPPGRSELSFALPVVAAPVLVHEWRLLLPEDATYRFARGALLPVTTIDATRPVGIDTVGSGSAAVTGTVRDEGGYPLPGVSVTLELGGSSRLVLTDAQGRYAFDGVEAGRGKVTAQLEGFRSAEANVQLRRDSAARADLVRVLTGAESITVISEAQLVDRFNVAPELDALRSKQRAESFEVVAQDLRQGTVGGVRPLEVEIPERGKLLLLTGALPPAEITATLEARRRR